MKRWLNKTFVAITILFLLVLVAAWIDSRKHFDELQLHLSGRFLLIDCDHGQFAIQYMNNLPSYQSRFLLQRPLLSRKVNESIDAPYIPGFAYRLLGFGFGLPPSELRMMTSGFPAADLPVYIRIGAPLWEIALPLAMLCIFLMAREILFRRRHTAGLCLKCGYDLRASPERCPECGMIPVEAKTA